MNKTKMDTSYVGHHVSSGGFVFYEDQVNKELFIALLQDKHNNWWIPKGHVESWESQVDAAFREIEEEIGIKSDQLEFIDFCYKDSYSYQENGGVNTKDVYINVFSVNTKLDISVDVNESDLHDVRWFTYDEALDIIAFNKNELVLAKNIFEQKHTLKEIRGTDIEIVRNKLLHEKFVKYIDSFIIFGSSFKNMQSSIVPADTDICIVLNDRNADLDLVSEFIYDNFFNPDFTIYYKDEIESTLPFMAIGVGVFAIEYFSFGYSIYGRNLFKDKLMNINADKYRESHLNKVFEYILRIRKEYCSKVNSYEFKKKYVTKYVIRLLRSLMLAEGYITYEELQYVSNEFIVNLARTNNIISSSFVINFNSVKEMYSLFEHINNYIVTTYTN